MKPSPTLLAAAALALSTASTLPAQQPQPDRTELLLQRLSDAPGPPGAEDPVRALMVPEMNFN